MEAYKYTPLQQPDTIRLLSVLPGEKLAPICIGLSEVCLNGDPSYEALSYTWATEDGDNERSLSLNCDGASIMVTKNCEAALRRFRKNNTERILWVDAISINQEDKEERAQQVGLMRDVYSQAREVLIWLGKASDEVDEDSGRSYSDIYMEYLSSMMGEVRRFEDGKRKPEDAPLYRALVGQVIQSRRGIKSALFRGFKDVENRSWWKRIWVVQEAVLARSATLFCGEKEVPNKDHYEFYFVWGKDKSRDSGSMSRYGTAALVHQSLFCFGQMNLHPAGLDTVTWIAHMLQICSSLQATDPRDRVFGLLGILDIEQSLLPRADYTKSWRQIFIQVAISFNRAVRVTLHSLLCDKIAGYRGSPLLGP